MLRCVSSGTEATMSALRVARGFTGRDVIVKFDGAYHGHSDSLLVKAGSGAATFGNPDSAGVPAAIVENTATLAYNDSAALSELFNREGSRIAAVIVEPVAGNMGCVPPQPQFLETILELCALHGALSIFDEVMTGCRVARGSAQGLFGMTPDLTWLGKVVGGGLPLAVYGGRADVMRCVAPLGAVYQAGTLSGNPIAVNAGLTTLSLLDHSSYERLEALGSRLQTGLERALRDTNTPGRSAARGLHAHGVLPPRTRALVARRFSLRHQAFRHLAPRAHHPWGILASLAVRSRIHLAFALGRGHRRYCRGGVGSVGRVEAEPWRREPWRREP